MKCWTKPFKAAANARIKEYEAFLESCGIAAISGAEQEFYVAVPQASNPEQKRKAQISESAAAEDSRKSHTLKAVSPDSTEPGLHDAIIGKGGYWQGKVKPQPVTELAPHNIVKAIDRAREKLESNVKKYTGDRNAAIDYDGSQLNVANSALQTKLSLWSIDSEQPLFRANKPDEREASSANALALQCADSLLEAQKALIATVITSPQSLERFRRMADRTTPDRFSIGVDKRSGHSVQLHVTNLDNINIKKANITTPSLYLENRLPGAAEEPALVMLMTVGGVAEGVKRYMQANGIKTPEEMKAHLSSSALDVSHEATFNSPFAGALPETMKAAYLSTRDSATAREIMGPELFEKFCAAHKKEALDLHRRGLDR